MIVSLGDNNGWQEGGEIAEGIEKTDLVRKKTKEKKSVDEYFSLGSNSMLERGMVGWLKE